MGLTSVVDCVVGPESAVVNFASCFDTPKIVFLSHSSHENLTKYWKNVYPLEPEKELAPCYPCHQLHYNFNNVPSCPLIQIQDDDGTIIGEGPVCSMGAIREKTVLDTLETIYQNKHTT
jgi:ADP-heptose:LPS heptosyltransferase